MNRLAKRCVIVSAVLHGTLALTLLLASGFARPVSQPPAGGELTILSALPFEAPATVPTVNANTHTEQATQANVVAPRVPTVTREPLRLVETTRHPVTPSRPRADEEPDAQEGAAQKTLATAIATIRSRASGSVPMGTFGETSGTAAKGESFEETLKRIYFNSWQQPADAASDEAVVKVSITVASDGTVLSADITKASGDKAVDRSVERLLKEVTRIAPFPPGSKESQRKYPLSFSLKAKRSLG